MLPTLDELGRVDVENGVELIPFTCTGCGYVRFHDLEFFPRSL